MTETTAVETVVETTVVRPGPSSNAIRRITLGTKKARKELEGVQGVATMEKDALDNIKAIAKLVGTEVVEDKYSPFGHSAKAQNGELDKAILTIEGANFAEWVKSVAKANPATRMTDLEDNEGFIKRLQSHLRFCSGRKPSGERDFPKRLARVGKEQHANEIMNLMVSVSMLFDEYVAAGKF